MQHLEDDMDELFQRAADSYHLQQPGWDWKAIETRIGDGSRDALIMPVTTKRNFGAVWFASLGMFFMLAGTIFLNSYNKASSFITHAQVAVTKIKQDVNPGKSNENIIINSAEEKVFNTSSTEEEKSFVAANKMQSTNANKHVRITVPAIDGDEFIPGKEKSLWMNESDEELLEKFETRVDANIILARLKENKVDGLKDIAVQVNAAKKIKKKYRPVFYIGIVAGSQFSKVKSTPFHNGSLDAGIIAGLQVNKRISIETGLLLSHKNYRSNGEYFKLDKIGSSMPATMVINKMEGRSSLIEIPLKIKYNIINKRNFAVFSSAGVTSCILTKERNKYNVTYNGNEQKMTAEYQKNDTKIPAVASFSIGYQHTLSKNINIRLEPFLNIPLQGIGMGSLPITTTGVHIAIVGHLK